MESSYDLIGAIHRSRKHQNSAAAIALGRRKETHGKKHCGGDSNCSSPVAVNIRERFCNTDEVSARKLGAGLWQWHNTQFTRNAFKCGSSPSSFSQLANWNEKTTFPHHAEKIEETKDLLRGPITILRTRNGLQRELESSTPLHKGSKEVATSKWNPNLNEAFNEFTMIHSRKLLQVGDNHSVVITTLLEQLLRAQKSINKLKAEQKSIKKKVEILLQNLKEENILWKHMERKKIKATLDDLRTKLERERRSRERIDLVNAKLVHELSEANSSVKHFMTNYEKEKKERDLMEEVCNELAMQIGEDKATLSVTLSESRRICEEVEEERKMMQMIDLWREERVQMKLVDAQFVLQDKYDELVQLTHSLQMFLTSKGADQLDAKELEDAKWIKQQVESVNIPGIMETI